MSVDEKQESLHHWWRMEWGRTREGGSRGMGRRCADPMSQNAILKCNTNLYFIFIFRKFDCGESLDLQYYASIGNQKSKINDQNVWSWSKSCVIDSGRFFTAAFFDCEWKESRALFFLVVGSDGIYVMFLPEKRNVRAESPDWWFNACTRY